MLKFVNFTKKISPLEPKIIILLLSKGWKSLMEMRSGLNTEIGGEWPDFVIFGNTEIVDFDVWM